MQITVAILLACVCIGCAARTADETNGAHDSGLSTEEEDSGAPDGESAQQADAEALPCTGDDGPLRCDDPRASPLRVSRFNASGACFEPAIELPDLCTVNTYCHASSGQLACIVAADGAAYVGFVLYGDQLTDGYHADIEAEMNLTPAERLACEQLAGSHGDDVLLTNTPNGEVRVGPACP